MELVVGGHRVAVNFVENKHGILLAVDLLLLLALRLANRFVASQSGHFLVSSLGFKKILSLLASNFNEKTNLDDSNFLMMFLFLLLLLWLLLFAGCLHVMKKKHEVSKLGDKKLLHQPTTTDVELNSTPLD